MSQEKDIFALGYDRYLYKIPAPVPVTTESPLVYNQIDDRLSLLVPAGQQITNVVPGLQTQEVTTSSN